MSVLLDTGVVYADHDTDASRHEPASRALEVVFDGKYGQPYVSEYVYDEAVTLTFKRSGSTEAAKRLGRRLRGAGSFPAVYEMLHVSPSLFAAAIDVFEQYDDQRLSFTDATLVSQCKRNDIDAILSFDDDFDGLVERLDPADV
ncbi:type II toxin-antitoxin system VapC family toxin [Haloarcula amylovorans]|uniref:type II toxin-antitoxin system VapC family toxin n=1 Tax=Haloarcula amylovorans TaxID=2562280 RepID=UPI0010767EDF|nr:type II toxin-antitoxin system VapC family toxin [Halomicroarcula amylolytica]